VTPRTCRDHLAGEPPGLLARGGTVAETHLFHPPRRRSVRSRSVTREPHGPAGASRSPARPRRRAPSQPGPPRPRHGERQPSRLCPGLTARVRTGASNAKDVAGPVRVVPGSGPEALDSRSSRFHRPSGRPGRRGSLLAVGDAPASFGKSTGRVGVVGWIQADVLRAAPSRACGKLGRHDDLGDPGQRARHRAHPLGLVSERLELLLIDARDASRVCTFRRRLQLGEARARGSPARRLLGVTRFDQFQNRTSPDG